MGMYGDLNYGGYELTERLIRVVSRILSKKYGRDIHITKNFKFVFVHNIEIPQTFSELLDVTDYITNLFYKLDSLRLIAGRFIFTYDDNPDENVAISQHVIFTDYKDYIGHKGTMTIGFQRPS